MGNITSKHNLPFEYIKTQNLEQTSFGNLFEVSLARRQAKILQVSNEQFGEAKNLLKANSVNIQGGQSEGTIDGWQVHRHLKEAMVHIRLCGLCHIKGVDIDTTGYTNGTAALSICLDGLVLMDGKKTWINLIPRMGIDENMHNFFTINQNDIYDTIRLTAFPGGGISRCRVYGDIVPTPMFDGVDRNMACGGLGAQVIGWNNALDCPSDILFDGDETESSGWITPRSREKPRNDAIIIRLAAASIINRVIINTSPFSDKAPYAVSVDVCFLPQSDPIQCDDVVWYNVIKQEKVICNNQQTILCQHHLPVSHIRLTLLPDGGMQQIKVIGYAYCGSYGDNLDQNTIDTHSFWNSTCSSEEALKSKNKPVASIKASIQQENIQEEPVISKAIAVVEKSANTALEPTADTANALNQKSPIIEINIGEQVNTKKVASDDTDTALTAAKMETGLNESIVEPSANDRQPTKEAIQSPIMLDSIAQDSSLSDESLSNKEKIEIGSKETIPLDEIVVPNDNIAVVSTDALANLVQDESTESKQDEGIVISKPLSKDTGILRDSSQYKDHFLAKDELYVKDDLENNNKQVDGENMARLSESDDTADRKPTKECNPPTIPVAISTIESAILQNELRSSIPEKKRKLSKKDRSKQQSAVLKEQHSHPNASFQTTTLYSYVSYSSTSSSPLIIKAECSTSPGHTQKEDDVIPIRPVTHLGRCTDALTLRKATQVEEPGTQRQSGTFKRIPTVLAECSSDSSSSEEEESEIWTDRTFPKTLATPKKRRRRS